ncbi:uncharacterized protein LOC119070404 [Bradysia coprophila]|uniref:uncharacterized protein LOC119070404 n=1 Tax=Bradysia coprophila TaxID=38358 RepID=UPI00187DA1A6|nr:uncharacterized protein LOC119070404 [Bradysia coprophila]
MTPQNLFIAFIRYVWLCVFTTRFFIFFYLRKRLDSQILLRHSGGFTYIKLSNLIRYNMIETPNTLRNIEIKARITDNTEFERKVKIAKKLTTNYSVIKQRDVFFNVTTGRLKLRFLENTKSQLIQYQRPDVEGPKLSQFTILQTDEPEKLCQMLTACIGIKGEVVKTRHLFIHNQTRIHLDEVKNLGTFLEFEVCLQPEQTIEYGTEIANEMMNIFDIRKDDMIQGAYLDELLK